MKSNLLRRISSGAVLLLACGAATAQVDSHLVLDAPVAGGATGSVDLLFRDFTTAGDLDTYEWIRNTIELQVHPSAGLAVQSLFLNFNPDLDITKLALYWTGDPMPPGPPGSNTFGDAGDKPSDIAIASNGFYAGGGELFDVFTHWNAPTTFSKLLLVYDGGDIDISFADFSVKSATAPFFTPPGFGPLLAAGAVTGPGGQGTIAAVPEPSALAMLAMGLLVLGIVAWRRKA
jgi:PEP-CTERM motif